MGKYDKPISEFAKCPNCNSDYGYYQRIFASGYINYQHNFVDGSGNNHEELYDHLNYSSESKFYCCTECNERIARTKHH